MNHTKDLKRIGDVFNVVIGGTPSRKTNVFWDNEKITNNVWLSIRDVSQNSESRIMDSAEYITDEGAKFSNVKRIPEGTALMTFKLTVGKTTISGTDLFTNEAIAAFIPKPGIDADPYYLATVLPTLHYESDQAVKGKTLNKAKIEDALIPLPVIAKQKRIAEILQSADKAITSTKKVIDRTERLKKALMHQLLTRGIGHTRFKQTEIGEIPESWELVKLGDSGIEILDGDRGVNYPNQKELTSEGDCLFLSTPNIDNGKFNFDSVQFISSERDRLLRKGKVQRNDIVLTTRGTVGRLAYYDDRIPFAQIRINSGMVIIRCDKNVFPPFLLQQLLSTRVQLAMQSIGSGSAQPQLPIGSLNHLMTVKPPLVEQKKIAEILEVVDEKIEINKKLKNKQEELKNGLMQDLLTGKVKI